MYWLHWISLWVAALAFGACAHLPESTELLPEQFAIAPAEAGLLTDIESAIASGHSPEQSAFRLLDTNADALRFCLALIDEAVSSLDLMYYLWYADDSGRLLLSRAIHAADRDVKVRFPVDDLLQFGNDKILVALHRHPNIQIRIVNPWRNRQAGRGLEFVANVGRLNTRMRNKLLIADNRAAIAGGRNIGDHYFGLSHTDNFHDLDALGIGPVARQASDMFDEFWNSRWVVSASSLPQQVDDAFIAKRSNRLVEKLQSAVSLEQFALEPQDWNDELVQASRDMKFGTSEFVFDSFQDGALIEGVTRPLGEVFKSAEYEILLTNAYIIPDQNFVDGISQLTNRGVDIRILTNSLASHDVPAVNSHYQKWRRPIVEAGAELYELRGDPDIKTRIDTAPVTSGFSGLHTKAFVVDRQTVFIGSMNFDPRSVNINTEMGIVIQSRALGEEMARLTRRDMSPENAWPVNLDDQGDLTWENSEESVKRQPAGTPGRGSWTGSSRSFRKANSSATGRWRAWARLRLSVPQLLAVRAAHSSSVNEPLI